MQVWGLEDHNPQSPKTNTKSKWANIQNKNKRHTREFEKQITII
jgi:hypothetical protein